MLTLRIAQFWLYFLGLVEGGLWMVNYHEGRGQVSHSVLNPANLLCIHLFILRDV
jgi:hypothetical protein